MPVGTISLKYTVKDFPYRKSYDTRVNVKDTIEFLRLSTVFNENGVGLSYLNSPAISPERNILIKDESDLQEGNSRKLIKEVEYFSDSFITSFANFYITDIVKVVDSEEVPLYFYHKIETLNIANLEVLDAELNPVDPELWDFYDETATLSEDRRGIYTNLQCSLDSRSSEYELFYVRYRDNDTNEVILHLLDSKPFYRQASFFSDRRKREFVITQLGDQYQVDVIFDSLNYSPTGVVGQQRYYVKGRDRGKIYIEQPSNSIPTQRWNLRISPGDLGMNGRRYWVPEYYTQIYSPTFPYRLQKEREVRLLETNLLRADLFPIVNLGIPGFYLYISVEDTEGTVIRAFTNDPDADTFVTKSGFVTDIFYEKDMIESVSENSGFIKLRDRIPSDSKVFLTYRYTENYFVYTDLLVNPSLNPDILGKTILMYVKPDVNGSENGVEHLIADDTGAILEASQTDTYRSFDGTATSGTVSTLEDTELPAEDFFTGFELEILSGLNAGVKVQITGYNTISKIMTVADVLPNPIEAGTTYRVVKKVKDYSTNDATLGQTYNYMGWESFALTNAYLKLGDVFVIQDLSISDVESFDSRILGGGVSESEEEAALQLQDEARWYWDIGNHDGTSYPGMGAILVELPRYILKELGGSFERDQVKDIVIRHMADGSYPVIKYYDKSTEIIDLVPGDMQVYVKWDLIDASEYRIYIGNSPDNLSLFQTQPGTRNDALLEGLENDKIYYIQIEPVVGGRVRLRSRIKSFVPFNFSTSLPPIKYDEGKYLGGTYA